MASKDVKAVRVPREEMAMLIRLLWLQPVMKPITPFLGRFVPDYGKQDTRHVGGMSSSNVRFSRQPPKARPGKWAWFKPG